MPTRSRGFWACDYCRQICDTFEEAREHEGTECPQRPPTRPPPHHHHPALGHPPQPVPVYFPHQPPPGLEHQMPPAGIVHAPSGIPYPGAPPPAQQSAIGGPSMVPYSHAEKPQSGSEPQSQPPYASGERLQRKVPSRCITLLGPRETSHMSADDSLACQNIEIFEASSEHAADADASRTGGTPVVAGQVGLRCVHCSSSPLSSAVYSMVFPRGLGSIAESVRMVADQHLSTCGMVPPTIQEAYERAAAKRKRESSSPGGTKRDEHDHSQMVLSDFCQALCQRLGVVNKQPQKTGIEFSDANRQQQPPHFQQHSVPYHPHPYHAHQQQQHHPHQQAMLETPVARGGRMFPPSSERMGGHIAYATPNPPGYPPRQPGYPGPPVPGEGPRSTPLQRRRDRPGEVGEAARSTPIPMPSNYPPYGQGPMGGEAMYPPDSMGAPPQHAEQGMEAHEPGGQHPGYAGQMPQFDVPSNFPFYQDANGSWNCKFCAQVHPQYREPQSVWSSPDGSPPPGNFLDHHLGMCRSYHQSLSPSMYQGPPPPYGAPYGQPGYPGWEPPSSHQGMHPYHGGSEAQPYPPYPGSHHIDAQQQGRFPEYGQSHLQAPSRHTPPQQQPPQQQSPPYATAGADQPQVNDSIADAVRQSISYLSATDKEQNCTDGTGNKLPRLVLDEDRLLLTDYFFHLMKQLRLCRFSEADRKTRGGKREKIVIGYGGLQCVHCADVPNSRKFFWSNVDRLANSFAEIPGHILKCRRCPQQTKDALLQLKMFHPEQMARLPRGSQKVFFRRMWRRLHDEDPKAVVPDGQENTARVNRPTSLTIQTRRTKASVKVEGSPGEASAQQAKEDSPATKDSDETNVVVQRTYLEAAKALASTYLLSQVSHEPLSPSSRILLSIPDDQEWLSDMDCFVRKQLEVFCATDQDVKMAKADRKHPVVFGQVGIRCIHCSLQKKRPAVGQAVAFPFSINSIYESVREFQRLHLENCENVPPATHEKLTSLQGSTSLSSVLRRYYVLAAKALGLKDTKDGIWAGAESVPLGSKAVFSFSDGHETVDELRQLSGSPENAEPSSPSEDSRKRKDTENDLVEEEPQHKASKADSTTAV